MSGRLFSIAEVRAFEAQAQATDPQPPLMRRAGAAIARAARNMLEEGQSVLVLAGPGNNGGDALVAARLLRIEGYGVSVVLAGDPARLPADAAQAYADWLAVGGGVRSHWPPGDWALVIDGLLGIGISRDPDGTIADLIRNANASGVPVLAIDVPSGLDADTGIARIPAIRARRTVTFLGDKIGLRRRDGPACAGEVSCDWLGLSPPEPG